MLPSQKFLFKKLLINWRFQQSFFKYIAAKYEKKKQKPKNLFIVLKCTFVRIYSDSALLVQPILLWHG